MQSNFQLFDSQIHLTVNTQHSTLNTQHSTLNSQHSTLNTQHSTLNSHLTVQPELILLSETGFLPPKLLSLPGE